MGERNGKPGSESRELYDKVIKNDYCIGCGSCTEVENSPFKIKFNEYGYLVAFPSGNLDNSTANVLEVCPFSEHSKNEDELSEFFFPDVQRKSSFIGKYIVCWAGFVNEDAFRENGSSGGIGKWLGYRMLKDDVVDHFVHVVPNQTNDPAKPLFYYDIVSEAEEVLKGSKSAYYPVTLQGIIGRIKKEEGRYAITGLPCFIKAIRLLSLKDKILKERIKYTVGIICGGMKSANQAKIIAWQLGISPEDLVAIDFRRKYDNKPASYKIYQVWSKDGSTKFRDSYDIRATDWGASYFKPNACDYCDDVVNETADISIGDAWLPRFEKDPKGTSLMIVRNKDLMDLILKYKNMNTLSLYELTAEEVAGAQAGGFRHRREGLSFRIAKKEKKKIWYPPKRVKANDYRLTRKRRKIYSLREKIAKKSHIAALHALERKDLQIFFKELRSLDRRYLALNYGRLPVRAVRKINRIIKNKLKLKK